MQPLIQSDDTPEGQAFKVQIINASEGLMISIVTVPTPVSPPLTHDNTELTFPMCGSGVDFDSADHKMIRKTAHVDKKHGFVDQAGCVTLRQVINVTGVMWVVNETSREIAGGFGDTEVYHC